MRQLMIQSTLIAIVIAVALMYGCAKDVDTEEVQPKVELLTPSPCDTLYYGEPFVYRIKITDPSGNGLGNLSLDIHNNFNHHSHGSHITCQMDPKKDPVDPYEEAWIFSLPDDKDEYVFEETFTFPEKKDVNTPWDEGDYHFHIYVTNQDGYQTFTTLDVKVLYKDQR